MPGIRYTIRGNEKVQAFLRSVPRGTIRTAIVGIVEYLIGNEQHGLKHEPPYKYVSRAQAYGKVSDAPAGYFSWAQFRYIMARISDGSIQPGQNNRTHETSQGYGSVETKGGYGASITNSTTGAYYTQSDTGQAAQPALVGWRKISKNIADNINGAMRHGTALVNEWLRRNGK